MTKIAAIQFSGNRDKQANILTAEKLVKQAVKNGADIVCLHELFNTMYFCTEQKYEYFKLAEQVSGPTINRMCRLACECGIVLIAPIFEKVSNGEYYNSAVILGPDGEIIGVYRKSHLPIQTQVPILEKFYFKPGNTGFKAFETPSNINIGVIICADRHFIEASRILGLKDVHVIFIPSATSFGELQSTWEIELRGHAVLNMCYVAGVNRVGIDKDGISKPFFGSSMIVSPNGEVLAKAGDKEDEIIYASIDIALISDMRNKYGYHRDRRPDLYSEIIE